MKTHAISMILVTSLAGCGGGIGFGSGGGGMFGGLGSGLFGGDRAQPTAAMPSDDGELNGETGLATGEGADAATASPGGDGLILGFAVASLGDATQPGLWMETPLVSAEGPGRVVGPDGRTVAVTLRPSGGGPGTGSRLSIQAMQALGLDLTSLPTVTVISDA